MSYHHRNIERLARALVLEIEETLEKAGIFYRIYFRCKKKDSLQKKLALKNENGTDKYDGTSKLLRDLIGIRINLYFVDDQDLLTEFIKEKYKSLYVEETIDENNTTEFKPTRTNLIFRIPEDSSDEFRDIVRDQRVDATFELQLRTVLSEGWHEVEHDLRYKCQSDWEPYPDMSRMFNGFLAALETQEWSMIQLFDRVSYQHYKNGNLDALVKTKLRIRLDGAHLSEELIQQLQGEASFIREFFKIDREHILRILLFNKPLFPITLENILFLVNHCFIKNASIQKLEPEIISQNLKNLSITLLEPY